MMTLLLWLLRIAAVALLVGTLLPFISTGTWWVRIWDFPRLQLTVVALVLLLLLALHAAIAKPRREHGVWLVVLLLAGSLQFAQVLPFTSLWPVEVPTAGPADRPDTPTASLSGGNRFSVLAANIRFENQQHDEVRALLSNLSPDLLLLVEVNQAWADALATVNSSHPHRAGVVREEGLGMVLWSKLPLLNSTTDYLVTERRPSIFTKVQIGKPHTSGSEPGAAETLQLAALHPTPPALRDRISNNDITDERRDSRVRDAELMLAAERVDQQPESRWLILGDLNDVAWSHTTRLFKQRSGLLDPRIGRHLMNTYPADAPLRRFPIDHIFVSDGFQLVDMKRVRVPGSDHFGVMATFELAFESSPDDDMDREARKEAHQMIRSGTEDAAEHEVSD